MRYPTTADWTGARAQARGAVRHVRPRQDPDRGDAARPGASGSTTRSISASAPATWASTSSTTSSARRCAIPFLRELLRRRFDLHRLEHHLRQPRAALDLPRQARRPGQGRHPVRRVPAPPAPAPRGRDRRHAATRSRFIDKAETLYGYDHFVCDTSGSLCEVVDPDDPADPVLRDLAAAAAAGLDPRHRGRRRRAGRRFDQAPKPMYYPEDFLTELWTDYRAEHGLAADAVDPDDFIRHGFRRADRAPPAALPRDGRALGRHRRGRRGRRGARPPGLRRAGRRGHRAPLNPHRARVRSGACRAARSRRLPWRLRAYLAGSEGAAAACRSRSPPNLPAHDVLTREGVLVMSEETAPRQDIRPLQIGLLNLMPKKVQTETQFARLIGATPLQIELTLIRMTEHQSKNTAAGASGGVLPALRRGPRPQVRRADRHRRADRASRVRGRQLLGRAARGVRLDADPRPSHLRRLLGRHGDAQPLPRHPQAHAAGQGVRLLPPPRRRAGLAVPAGLLRQLHGAGQPLDRGARRGRRACTPTSPCWSTATRSAPA